jgi:hypothetical protein
MRIPRALQPSTAPSLLLALAVGVCPLSEVGCGPAAPPPAAPVVASAPPPPPAPPPPDLSAVPDPKTLVVTGRMGKLATSLAMVHGWSKLPMPQSEQVTELITSEAVGALVDLDQPIDFAVAVSGTGMRVRTSAAISAGVKDPEQARTSLAERFKLVPGDNGTTLIKGLGRPSHKAGSTSDDDEDTDGKPDPEPGGDEDGNRVCELAASFGDAPVRLVCAGSSSALAELGPWLTRTATRAPATADLHVEVRLDPLRSTINEGKRLVGVILGGVLGGAVRGKAARDLVGAVGADLADFASDMDGASLDVTMGDPGAQMTTTLKLSGTSSAIGRLAIGHPERSGSPPAAFWQLPGDADLAFFERGIDDAPIARARDLLLDGLGAGLVDDGVKPADVKAVTAAVGKLVTGAPVSYASGLDVPAVRKALSAEKAIGPDGDPAARADARHATAEQLLGWRVLEVDQPPAIASGALKDLAAAVSRPSLVAAVRAHDKEITPLSLRSAPMPKGATLPAGSLHWVVELPLVQRAAPPKTDKKPPPTPKPLVTHLLFVPDGPRTWVGLGGDDVGVASRLAASLATGGDKLSGRADLAPFKDVKVGAGGFLTGRAVPELALQLRIAGGGSTGGVSEALDDVDQMPQKGMSAMLFSSTAQPGGPPSTTISTLTIPRGTIEDLVTTILRHGGF